MIFQPTYQKCKIVHTDVKPENVLLCIPPPGEDDAGSLWWKRNSEGADHDKSGPERLRKGWSRSWLAPKHFRAKLVDLGNACPEDRPFTDDIQTIEYRCPEVVVGAKFDAKVLADSFVLPSTTRPGADVLVGVPLMPSASMLLTC